MFAVETLVRCGHQCYRFGSASPGMESVWTNIYATGPAALESRQGQCSEHQRDRDGNCVFRETSHRTRELNLIDWCSPARNQKERYLSVERPACQRRDKGVAMFVECVASE